MGLNALHAFTFFGFLWGVYSHGLQHLTAFPCASCSPFTITASCQSWPLGKGYRVVQQLDGNDDDQDGLQLKCLSWINKRKLLLLLPLMVMMVIMVTVMGMTTTTIMTTRPTHDGDKKQSTCLTNSDDQHRKRASCASSSSPGSFCRRPVRSWGGTAGYWPPPGHWGGSLRIENPQRWLSILFNKEIWHHKRNSLGLILEPASAVSPDF